MDESASSKVLESLERNGGQCVKTFVSVEGYDTSLQAYPLELAVKKHFSSCGNIDLMFVDRDYVRNTLKSPLYIRFWDLPCASEKALQLSGTDVGGWSVLVKAVPPRPMRNQESIPLSRKFFSGSRQIRVTGFDTSLPEVDIQIGLCNLFSSCGEVAEVLVSFRIADIKIVGQGCVEKAQQLCGRDVGGMTIQFLSVLPEHPSFPRRCITGCEHPFAAEARLRMTAKMTTKEIEKMTWEEKEKVVREEVAKITSENKKKNKKLTQDQKIKVSRQKLA